MIHLFSKKSSVLSVNGFTLIESLVTIIIVGVLAAISTPSLVRWLNNKKIEDVTTQVFGALEVSRSSAVRLNQPCTLTLTPNNIDASPAACLPSTIDLSELLFDGVSANIATQNVGNIPLTAGADPDETSITFSPRGSTTVVEDNSAIVIFDSEAPTDRTMGCIVVSSGIGLMRQGTYQADEPPTSESDVDEVAANCITPS